MRHRIWVPLPLESLPLGGIGPSALIQAIPPVWVV
jgi:hypothetical protein